MEENKPKRRGPALVAVGLVAGLLASSLTVWNATQAAFSATTENDNNEIKVAGPITLTDNDLTGAMFTAADFISSSDSVQKCIQVTYAGNADAGLGVQLYSTGALGGTLAASDVMVTIEKGAGVVDAFAGCTGFAAEVGGGAYSWTGQLDTFRTNCATWSGTPHAACDLKWTPQNSNAKFFRFTATLKNTSGAVAGDSLTGLKFMWEARS